MVMRYNNMYTELITLLTVKNERTPQGSIEEQKIASNEIFAELLSVGLKQFTELSAVGMKPEKIFKIADYYDYDGQEFLVHNGKRYNILRTYRKSENNELEITVGAILNKGGEDYSTS